MTATTKEIFEKYQVRKNKKQKKAFREYLKNVTESNGYEYKEEMGAFGAKNVVIGNVDEAKVIYTAHYDTQAIMPTPYVLMPKHPFLTIMLQVLFVFGMLFLMMLGAILICLGLYECGVSKADVEIVYFVLDCAVWTFLILFPYCGIANKHTANDNTSGVTTLIDIMTSLEEDQRKGVAFVFFDKEELGLLGSSGFANKHKNVKENTLVVNFDCVSDGKKFMFFVSKKSKAYADVIKRAFVPTLDFEVEVAYKGVYYPSDQKSFKKGVGVASFLKKGKMEYINKIHSKKDTVYNEENIKFLVNGSKKLINELSETEE